MSAAHGVQAFSIGVDLGVYEAERTVLDAVAARGRHIDILVNNAGFSIPQSYAAVPWQRQRDFLMTMIVSACGLTYAVIPGMVERGAGAIINVASLAGFAPGMAGHTLYPAGKSFSIKFSEALHEEYAAKGIRVTAVCPGFTHTEFALANGTQAVMDASPRMFFQTAGPVIEANSLSARASPVAGVCAGECGPQDGAIAVCPKMVPASMTSQAQQYTPRLASTEFML